MSQAVWCLLCFTKESTIFPAINPAASSRALSSAQQDSSPANQLAQAIKSVRGAPSASGTSAEASPHAMGSCTACSESWKAPELLADFIGSRQTDSFQDAVITVEDDVPYDPSRHGSHEIQLMHDRSFCRIRSQGGESLAEVREDLITITRGGKIYPILLDRPICNPFYKIGLSPDGRICAALAGDEAGGGRQGRLYLWRLDGVGRESIRSVPMEGPLINARDVRVTDNGTVCLRSMPADGWKRILHHWQPGAGLRSVQLPFNFHSIAAVAPNGRRLLLDGFIEDTQCVFLIDLNPADPKRQYNYCILKTVASQAYLNHSHGCFSPDSEVLAMEEKFDDGTAIDKWTMLFVNVSEAVSNGGEINSNNPAIARRSSLITVRPECRAFATGPSFLSDGMTVVKTIPLKNDSTVRYAQEVCFPFAHEAAIREKRSLGDA